MKRDGDQIQWQARIYGLVGGFRGECDIWDNLAPSFLSLLPFVPVL